MLCEIVHEVYISVKWWRFSLSKFSWRAPDLKLLKMEVLLGLGISDSWQVSWSFILIGWLVITLRLEVQTQALAICISVAVNLLKYEFEFLVLCWESYFINLNKGGAVGTVLRWIIDAIGGSWYRFGDHTDA